MQYFNTTGGYNEDDCCYNHPLKALCFEIIAKFSVRKGPLPFEIGCMKIQIQGIFIPSKQISFAR